MVFRTNGVQVEMSDFHFLTLHQMGIDPIYEATKAAEEAVIKRLGEFEQILKQKENANI